LNGHGFNPAVGCAEPTQRYSLPKNTQDRVTFLKGAVSNQSRRRPPGNAVDVEANFSAKCLAAEAILFNAHYRIIRNMTIMVTLC
jgi:hypothetical protein